MVPGVAREKKNCWEDFDTTPPSWVGIESARTRWDEWLADMASWVRFEFEKFRWRQANLQQYIFWSLIPVLLVLLWHIIFRRRGKTAGDRWQKTRPPAPVVWPGLDFGIFPTGKTAGGARPLPQAGGRKFFRLARTRPVGKIARGSARTAAGTAAAALSISL